MRKSVRTAVSALGTVLSCTAALAVPVKWTFEGVTIKNGSTISGSFVFDRNTWLFSDVDVLLTAGAGGYHDERFVNIAFSSGNYLGVVFSNLPTWWSGRSCDDEPISCGSQAFGISIYPNEMTNEGGVIPLSRTWLGRCGAEVCNTGGWLFYSDYYYDTPAGSIIGVAVVPEPSTYALMLAGLASIAGAARARRCVSR